MRFFTQPACPSGFADADVFMFVIPDLSDGRHTFNKDFPDFTGRQSYLSVTSLFGHQLSIGPCRSDQLAAPSDFQFHVMNQGPQRNILQGHGVARFDIRFFTAVQDIADVDLRGCDNVSFFTVTIIEQGDSSRSVWIIFDRSHLGRNVGFIAAKINHPVFPFVTAADMPGCDSSVTVTAAFLLQRF